MRRLALMLILSSALAIACGSPSGMAETPGSANPAPANEPDTEPLPATPKKRVPDPKVPLDAGHGK